MDVGPIDLVLIGIGFLFALILNVGYDVAAWNGLKKSFGWFKQYYSVLLTISIIVGITNVSYFAIRLASITAPVFFEELKPFFDGFMVLLVVLVYVNGMGLVRVVNDVKSAKGEEPS